MTTPRIVLPRTTATDLPTGLRQLAEAGAGRPCDDVAMEFCTELSRTLLRLPEARTYPELMALGFWMRPAELAGMKSGFAALETDETILVPRGTVFHIPPANVDTIFVYSWVLSLLAGNKNVVRLPGSTTEVAGAILTVLGDLMEEARFAAVAGSNLFVSYGHDVAVTSAISDECSLRVIWGGDETVRTIREVPLPPHARDLTFPDRRSVSVLSATAVATLPETELDRLAQRLYNDAFWFDQMGCSSPTVLFWVGDRDIAAATSASLMTALEAVIQRKGYRVEAATGMKKLVHSYDAVMGDRVVAARRHSGELTVLDLNPNKPESPPTCGGGLFYQAAVESLADISDHVDRRVQTVGHFGFDSGALVSWARDLRGRGVDRIVPVGEALSFNRYWDGYDLFQEFTRRVVVQGGGRLI